jgi:hypothetical protein
MPDSTLYMLLAERTKRAVIDHNWILARALAGALAELDMTNAVQQGAQVAWNQSAHELPILDSTPEAEAARTEVLNSSALRASPMMAPCGMPFSRSGKLVTTRCSRERGHDGAHRS